MRKLFFLIILFAAFSCKGGNHESVSSNVEAAPMQGMVYPAKWKFIVEQKNGETELVFKLTLDKGWHTYSQFTPDGGPLPMVYTFDPSTCYERIGKVNEPKPITVFEEVFGVNTLLFHDEVIMRQRIKVKEPNCRITGKIEYQACQESCIPLDTVFSFTVGDGKESTTNKIDIIKVTEIPVDSVEIAKATKDSIASAQQQLKDTSTFNTGLEPACGTSSPKEEQSFLGIFIAGMLGGLVALLTPCVFPMFPMTVSFFTKRSGTRKKGIRNALIYALSIILIYDTLGLLVTISLGSYALNDLSSNAFFNLSFFVIFVIFAISFFGAFEITLPNWIINKADTASDRGGLLGIFFMAFTLSLVSFSCTGPIIGTLLVQAAQENNYLGPLAGMTGFSVALAIPFALFSMFPTWLNSLPKSGGWLNSVKVTLGFIELALALKFLSNVDLAYHWGFLKRELFICIWIIIFIMLGFYLLGKIKLSHDSDMPFIGTGRLIFSLLVFTFALYLIPGIWGAPLKLISGFPPPEFYKEWTDGKENECPHDLNCFHDYEEGMAYARLHSKPVMLDFTGWSCVNCRKMEDKVWSEPKVLKHLRDDYVLISLYVDDKMALPESLQYVSEKTKKLIKTVGHKWSEMQSSKYGTNTQPYYVLIDNKAKILAEPRGGIIPVDDYQKYLEEGLCRYKLRN